MGRSLRGDSVSGGRGVAGIGLVRPTGAAFDRRDGRGRRPAALTAPAHRPGQATPGPSHRIRRICPTSVRRGTVSILARGTPQDRALFGDADVVGRPPRGSGGHPELLPSRRPRAASRTSRICCRFNLHANRPLFSPQVGEKELSHAGSGTNARAARPPPPCSRHSARLPRACLEDVIVPAVVCRGAMSSTSRASTRSGAERASSMATFPPMEWPASIAFRSRDGACTRPRRLPWPIAHVGEPGGRPVIPEVEACTENDGARLLAIDCQLPAERRAREGEGPVSRSGDECVEAHRR